ncbi:TlpA family protein disulfide reductase [Steroidobacter sp. S1-65]|uniref:TlpA family protein disulfide reductase n=1 Tax=Steroidobacter gossypii TaxID=2805490 RepID=A0ABS1WR97_9GAMM|nr:TlpA disulfide reductase family protein [Steroidobacter gossypii]MBM0103476.1 TlpA family protein disulfide reductase [Steroidobacter gossypii]
MKPIGYIAVAVIAAAAGFGIYQFGIAPRVAVEPPQAASQTAPAEPSAAADESGDTALPETLPDFTLANLEGQPQSIRSWQGKSMIVNFWATWCAPCRREIPLLKKIQADHGDEGFQVVGVAVDFREDVLKYAKEIGIDYPLLIGEQDGMEAVTKFGRGSLGFPFTVFTDNQQRLVLFHLGEIHPPQAEVMLAAVRKVNSGELTPIQARTVAAKQLAELPRAQE